MTYENWSYFLEYYRLQIRKEEGDCQESERCPDENGYKMFSDDLQENIDDMKLACWVRYLMLCPMEFFARLHNSEDENLKEFVKELQICFAIHKEIWVNE